MMKLAIFVDTGWSLGQIYREVAHALGAELLDWQRQYPPGFFDSFDRILTLPHAGSTFLATKHGVPGGVRRSRRACPGAGQEGPGVSWRPWRLASRRPRRHGFLLPASNDRDVNGTGIPKRMALSAWQPWVDLLGGIQAHPGCLAGAGWFLPHLRWEALVFCHLALACWGWCHFFPSSSPRVFFFGLRQRYDLCLRNRECNGSSH
jgi:hypothetical protein